MRSNVTNSYHTFLADWLYEEFQILFFGQVFWSVMFEYANKGII